MRDLTSIEEKILDKTLYLIGRTGKLNVPVRAIAKEAQVNISAINYYFRTKDDMMDLVKKFYIENTIEAYSALDDESYDIRNKLVYCASDLIEYIIRYPGITVILNEARKHKDLDPLDGEIVSLSDSLDQKFNQMIRTYFEALGFNPDLRQLMFFSTVLYPALIMENNELFASFVREKNVRIKYIKDCLDLLLGKELAHEN